MSNAYCSRCRNVYAAKRDLKHFIRRISSKRPEDLGQSQKNELNKYKDQYVQTLNIECSCGKNVTA